MESLSTTVQLTVTLLVYQPFVPCVPTTLGVITGGVLSPTNVTLLSPLVEAMLRLPEVSLAAPAAIEATTVPLPAMPLTLME